MQIKNLGPEFMKIYFFSFGFGSEISRMTPVTEGFPLVFWSK